MTLEAEATGVPVMAFRPDGWECVADAATYADAIAEIKNPAFCLSKKYQEQQLRAVRIGAHPEIVEFERLLIRRMRKLGVPMFAHCVYRGERDQAMVYVAGNSRARWGESPHNFGCAVDIIHGLRAWSIPRRAWEVVGHVGKEVAKSKGLKVAWGGDFKNLWDPAHWELADWKERARGRDPLLS